MQFLLRFQKPRLSRQTVRSASNRAIEESGQPRDIAKPIMMVFKLQYDGRHAVNLSRSAGKRIAGCILPASSLTPSAAFALGGGSCATRHASRPPNSFALSCVEANLIYATPKKVSREHARAKSADSGSDHARVRIRRSDGLCGEALYHAGSDCGAPPTCQFDGGNSLFLPLCSFCFWKG